MPFTLEELLPRGQQLRTVQRHDCVADAIGLMYHHRYDQLPVVESDGKTSLRQVVTFDGVLQALTSFNTQVGVLTVRDVAQPTRTYAPDADLLATLDDIQRDNFALVVDDQNALIGIVTTADTTVFFREYAEDLMLIEGIELRIKDAIKTLYLDDDTALEAAIAAVTDRAANIRKKVPAAIRGYLEKAGITPPADDTDALAEAERRLGLPKPGKLFEDLTIEEYSAVLLAHQQAPRLPRSSKVDELRGLLQKVRVARNKLAHFRGELSLEERRDVRFASDWLEQNLPVPRAATPVAVPTPATVETPSEEEEEETAAPQGTYAPISSHLASQSASTTSLTMSFADLEPILGKELPRSAYEYRAWWANDPSKPQSAAWLNEGWRATAISMTEQRLTFVRTSDREDAYIEFFAELNSRLEDEPDFPLRNLSPQGQSWHILAALPWVKPESVNLNASFTRRKQFRIELYIDSGDRELNKERFDQLQAHKQAVETGVGEPLSWERMDHRRACRIAVYTNADILTDFENETLLDWGKKKAVDLYRVFRPEFGNSNQSQANGGH